MFRLPNFNLVASVWEQNHWPTNDPPDHVDVPCQLFFSDKESSGYQITFNWFTTPPPIWARIAKGSLGVGVFGYNATPGIFEIPQGSGFYYASNFIVDVHLGFANEYMSARLVKCDGDGAFLWGGWKGFSTYWPSDYPPHAP